MKQLRCAVIGCGRIGCGFDDDSKNKMIRTHAGSYFHNKNTKLVALCDIDKIKLHNYGKKYQILGLYSNSSEMFKNEKIDCVSVCTLADTHFELVKDAVKFNVKGIFLEKPICDNLKDADQIIRLCKKHDIILAIDHQRRFDPFYHSIKEFLTQGKLGDIQLINVYYGSGISNTGSHMFDIIRFFFGEVASVEGNFSKNKSVNTQDPNIDVILEFTNKTLCRIQSLDWRHYASFEMDIFGTLGRLRLNLVSNEITYLNVSSKDSLVYKKLIPADLKVKKSKHSAIELGVQNLVSSVRKKMEPQCSGEDGYKSLELIIAAIQSARKKRKIFLPLSKNNYKISSK